ncbi:MAG TPA: DUF559 domain-containing protein [Bacteroidia bacterium]|nr:DUF559 domain-containing protein [Bacteroidia bacterium]
MSNQSMHYGALPITFQRAKELRAFMTAPEKILWEYLNKNQLGLRFRRQHPVSIYIADFYCHQIKLAIEIDGKSHDSQVDYDARRDLKFNEFGIKVLRFKNEEVAVNLASVVKEIELEMEILRKSPQPPAP